MKKVLTALALLTVSTGAGWAQTGNTHGENSRGEPINSSYRASGVDPATGFTPGYTAAQQQAAQQQQYVAKKKKVKRAPVQTTGQGRRY